MAASVNCVRRVLVTGGTQGIGSTLVMRLLADGEPPTKVIIVGRSRDKFNKLCQKLTTDQSSCLVFYEYDLSLMQQVKDLSQNVIDAGEPMDAIVHCAGVMLPKRIETLEGLETVFAVQYLARFYLNQLLAPMIMTTMKKSRSKNKAVIIVVSAGGTITNPSKLNWNNLQGEKKYDGVYALKHESIANDMQVLRYRRDYPDLISWYNYGPGYVSDTQLLKKMPIGFQRLAGAAGLFVGISAERAANDIHELLCHPDKYRGVLYRRNLKEANRKKIAWRLQPQNIDKLFQVSEELLQNLNLGQGVENQ